MSQAEILFFNQCDQDPDVPTPAIEFRFHRRRKWRFDFAWLSEKVAVEIEGGSWSGGRHVRGSGFERDCEKYNQAAFENWRVFRFPTAWVMDGRAIAFMRAVFEKMT
jgi:very-short-patch-repair endonuclease